MSKYAEVKTDLSALPLTILLIAAPFAAGLYYEYLSCAVSVFLVCYLVYAVKKRGRLAIPKSLTLLCAALIPLCSALTALWAVDSGMALLGFVKFLPLPLFLLCAYQLDKPQREAMLKPLPLSAAVMTLMSVLLGLIPALKSTFFVGSRLAGFFGYPNVFALYLLIALVLTASEGKWNLHRAAILAILALGIFLSGSRTAFVLLVIAVVWLSIASKDKQTRVILLGTTAVLIAASAVYTLVSGNATAVGRFITTSLGSSTLLGRLLYFKDALPVIASHPFGLGYMGYHFAQGSFQTGVYSVMNIHNELLQIMLDIGWIPAVLVAYTAVKGFIKGSFCTRIVLFTAAVHCMMDFDLQFIALCFILLLVMLNTEEVKEFKPIKHFLPAAVVLSLICVYFGLASALYYTGNFSAAVKVYPAYTMSWEQLLTEAKEADSMNRIADKILKCNKAHSLANSAKARVAYSKGDFGKMIEYKEKAIAAAKYSLDEYLDYASMLQIGIQLYEQSGDKDSAEICREKILAIPDMVQAVNDDTSDIALKLDDKPELTLPDDFLELLNNYTD